MLKVRTCFQPHCTVLHEGICYSEPEEPDTTKPISGSDLRGLVWWLFKGVRQPDRENTEPQTEGAQKSPNKWKLDPVCPGGTCSYPWPCHWLGKGQKGWYVPSVPKEMSAHQVSRCHLNQLTVKASHRSTVSGFHHHWASLLDIPSLLCMFSFDCSFLCFLLFLSLFFFTYYTHKNSIIPADTCQLSYIMLSLFPPKLMYMNMPAFYLFITDDDPSLGQNV